MPDVMTNLEQQSDRKLPDRSRPVRRNVGHDNFFLPRAIDVDHVIARRQHADIFYTRTRVEHAPIERRLIRQNDLRRADPLYNLFNIVERRPIMDRAIAERLEPRPRQIARVESISVKHNNFHRNRSLLAINFIHAVAAVNKIFVGKRAR